MQQVTLIGGSGFLGSYVCKALCDAGYRVRIMCRHPNAASHLKLCGSMGQVGFVRGSIRSKEDVTQAMNGSIAVVNLTGILYEKGKQHFDSIHHQGAANVAEATNAQNIEHLVHISALGIDASSKTSRYAKSKLAGEAAVKEHFPHAVILRPSIIIGAGDSFFNRFKAMARFSPFLPLIGGGKTRFQPVYAGNVAKAVTQAIASHQYDGKTYELGGKHRHSFKLLMAFMLRKLGIKRALLPIPYPIAKIMGFFGGFLPTPPITMDQVELMKYDNVVLDTEHDLHAFGITPKNLEEIVPTYL